MAAHLLGRLALSYADAGGTPAVQHLLEQLGHVRANDITLRGADGAVLYHSPPAAYKAGREAPGWFGRLLRPHMARQLFALPDGAQLAIDAEPSRAILDAWDELTRLVADRRGPAGSGERARLLAGRPRARARSRSSCRGSSGCERGELAYRLPALPAPRHTPSAPPSTAWRAASRTTCRPSAPRTRRAAAWRSAASWRS